jgi:hypothetical protein
MWMKKIIFSISLFLFVFCANAQEMDTTKTTSKFNSIVSQYYFEAGMHIGQVFNNKAGMVMHFSGNVVLYKKYHLGVQYERLTNFSEANLFANDTALSGKYTFKHQSAGIRFAYAVFHNKKYQLQPNLSVNWAMIYYRSNQFDISRWNFCVIEPGINFSYILHPNVSIGAGLHYRLNLGLNKALVNKDLNGLYGSIFLRFGLLQ